MRHFTDEHSRVVARAAAYDQASLAVLAKKIGITRQALEISLKGGNPGMATIHKISAALGIPLEKVLAPVEESELVIVGEWYSGLTGGRR